MKVISNEECDKQTTFPHSILNAAITPESLPNHSRVTPDLILTYS
jgi:hypothetical protein